MGPARMPFGFNPRRVAVATAGADHLRLNDPLAIHFRLLSASDSSMSGRAALTELGTLELHQRSTAERRKSGVLLNTPMASISPDALRYSGANQSGRLPRDRKNTAWWELRPIRSRNTPTACAP